MTAKLSSFSSSIFKSAEILTYSVGETVKKNNKGPFDTSATFHHIFKFGYLAVVSLSVAASV